MRIAPEVAAYIVDIGRATRQSPSLSLGVSPRGATALLATSRAWAWMNGRTFVTPDDVKALAHATLAHRLTPVSYTHLDVYKRQVLERAWLMNTVAVDW